MNLKEKAEQVGDGLDLPKPLTEAEMAKKRELLLKLPKFRYHPDSIEDVERYLVKDGFTCVYLFRCLHC